MNNQTNQQVDIIEQQKATERPIYTFQHSANFLQESIIKNTKNQKINIISIPELSIKRENKIKQEKIIKRGMKRGIKRGYSVTELFKAILTHSDIPSSFYTFFFVRGRRILAPNTFIHKYVLQYSIEEAVSLISNARMRIYHLFKYEHEGKSKIKIQQGFIKFAPLSKADKSQLITTINHGLENIFSPSVLQYITLSGGQLFPYHSLLIHNFFSFRQSESV